MLSVFLLLGGACAWGQESRKEVCVDFPVGVSALDESYGENAARLPEILSFLKQVEEDDALDVVGVAFCGAASPEGTSTMNKRLAAERTAVMERYVRERMDLPDSIVTHCEGYIAWDKLARLVRESDMPAKQEVLEVLDEATEFTEGTSGFLNDSRKERLMNLQYGRTWRYMTEHFFPQLRNASAVFVTLRRKTVEPEVPAAPEAIPEEVAAPVTPEPQPALMVEEEEGGSFCMALKTNLLYDMLALPNLGVEFYCGKGWSVAGGWTYGWWSKNSRHRYWRAYGGELAVRKWFGTKAEEQPLAGHHLGLFGQLFTYDFEWGGKGYMGGQPGGTLWDKFNYAAGIEYGYSWPVARRLHLDFVLGVGYWGGKYHKYIPLDGHYVWKETRNRHWVGPVKAEISLVWLLGKGSDNNQKGGLK